MTKNGYTQNRPKTITIRHRIQHTNTLTKHMHKTNQMRPMRTPHIQLHRKNKTMTTIPQFFINHPKTISLRAHALRSKNKKPKPPITPKQALNLILDGIAIIGIMELIQYVLWTQDKIEYSGLCLVPIILIWLTIKHYEDKRGEKQK